MARERETVRVRVRGIVEEREGRAEVGGMERADAEIGVGGAGADVVIAEDEGDVESGMRGTPGEEA